MDINKVPAIQDGLYPRELLNIISTLAGADGYVNYIYLGKVIRNHPNLNYSQKNLTLGRYLREYSYYLDFKEDLSGRYVRIKHRTTILPKQYMSLSEWAYMDDSEYERLETSARKENWRLGDNRFYILKSYLNMTFKRLASQKGILVDEKSGDAVFNTGLITESDEYIYAHLRMNYSDEFDPICWRVSSFVTEESGDGEYLKRIFGDNFPPPTADYFYDYRFQEGTVKKYDNIRNFLYVPGYRHLKLACDHICLDNIGRFPLRYLEKLVSVMPEFQKNLKAIYSLSYEDDRRKEFMRALAEQLKNDIHLYEAFCTCISKAVEHTFALATRNYKIVVPMYYAKEDTVNMLFPLWLQDSTKSPDVALIVQRVDNNRLEAKTMIPIEWAYLDSRVIAPVDTAWLLSGIGMHLTC